MIELPKLAFIFLTMILPIGIVSFVSSDVADQSQLFCRNPNYVSADGSPIQMLPVLLPENFGRSVCNPRPHLSQLENDQIIDSLSEHRKQWYSKHLVAACETSLFDRRQAPITKGETVIRFLWLRSFDPTVIVRVHFKEDGTSSLVAKELSGLGGYDAGKMASRIERSLSNREQQQIRRFLQRSKFFEQEAEECGVVGFDGARWVFEKSDQDGYKYVDRWSPRSGDAYDLGVLMLDITGWY